MGSWNIWHFVIFVLVAIMGVLRTASANKKGLGQQAAVNGYGGWLVVLSLFLLFWAAQEISEFYRVKNQIEILVPSALADPQYQEYIRYAMGMAWFEALLLLACVFMLAKGQAMWVINTVIAALWIAGPVCAFVELLMSESYFSEYLLEEDYSALAVSILFATTWTCYLLLSGRVKNTYGARLDSAS